MIADRVARVTALIGGLLLVGFGLWAVVDSRSFFDRVALWPPYNAHFIHDIGTFQIGLGLALLFALARSDALLVALAAVAIGQSVHAGVHVIDRHRGGNPTDPLFMTALAIVLLIGAFSRWRSIRRERQ